MKKNLLLFSAVLLFSIPAVAQDDSGVMRLDEFRNPKMRKLIDIPNVN